MRVATYALGVARSLWENPWLLRIALVLVLLFGWVVGA